MPIGDITAFHRWSFDWNVPPDSTAKQTEELITLNTKLQRIRQTNKHFYLENGLKIINLSGGLLYSSSYKALFVLTGR